MQSFIRKLFAALLQLTLFLIGGYSYIYLNSEIVGSRYIGEKDIGRLLIDFLLGGVVTSFFAYLMLKKFLPRKIGRDD